MTLPEKSRAYRIDLIDDFDPEQSEIDCDDATNSAMCSQITLDNAPHGGQNSSQENNSLIAHKQRI